MVQCAVGGDSDVTLRGRYQRAGKLSGGMDGGGVRESMAFARSMLCIFSGCSGATRNGLLV
jgi:hypothetical protein